MDSYRNAFIRVAADCPAQTATEPILRNEVKTQACWEYELLLPNPYRYTHDEFQFAAHVAHKGISKDEIEDARQEYFAVSHACLRASALAKRWGWGFHFDADGRVALVGLGSEEYEKFLLDQGLQQLPAMRSKRQR
ncbi:MAG: hypothetical protein H7Y17_01175 [Chlorobia bacterium]|nr:hypothetical protein [Fimbriimonadaceae bacterium]